MNLRKKDLLYLFLIFLIWILFFHKELFNGYFIFLRDVKSLYFPYKSVITNIFLKGEFPYWNQYINCGEPILSNPQYMLFYPTYYLFYFTGNIYFFQLHFLIHILIGSIGFYFFSKKHLKSEISAFLGSILYGFSGFSISHLLFQNMICYIGLLPWFLISIRQIYFKRNWKNALWLSILVILMIFSIEPYYFLFSMLIGGIYLFYIGKGDFKSILKLKKEILLAILFTLLLGSIQIIPAFDLLKISPRGKITSKNKYYFETNDLFNVFIGNFYGSYLSCDVVKMKKEKSMPFFLSFYFGTPIILIFLLGLYSINKRERYLILFTILFLLSISYGGITYKFIKSIPPFNMGRYSVKFFFPIFLLISFFFSKGIDQLKEIKKIKEILIPSIIAFSFIIATYLSVNFIIKYDLITLKRINREILIQLILFFIIIALFLAIMKFKSRERFLLIILSMTLLVNVFEGNRNVKYSIQKEIFLKKPFYASLFKRKEKILYRISPDFSKKYLFLCKTKKINPYFYAIEGCDDFMPSTLSIKQGFLVTVGMLSEELIAVLTTKIFKNEIPLEEVLNFLPHTSVKYVVAQEPIECKSLKTVSLKSFSRGASLFYYKFNNTYPIFHFSNTPHKIKEKNLSFLFRKFDDKKTFYLPEKEYKMVKNKFLNKKDMVPGKITLTKIKNNLYKFKVILKENSFLILNELHYPGWKVFIDGKEVNDLHVNLIFQGVLIQKGKHTVLFKYFPPGFKLALILFYIGIFIILIFIIHDLFSKKDVKRI